MSQGPTAGPPARAVHAPDVTTLHNAHFAGLDAVTLHDLVRLRIDVFVVEQQCPYEELDGRDTEPGTRHVWATDGGAVVGCLRLLTETDGSRRIGRVCIATSHRGKGVAGDLMAEVLRLSRLDSPAAALVLDAQTYLAGWYERLGFEVDGAEFVEDGIAHVPMRRPA